MKTKIIYGFLFALAIGMMAFGLYEDSKVVEQSHTEETEHAGEVSHEVSNEISYQGHSGVDALTLLEEKATVIEENGFVTSINGKEASLDHEFWAFYVNGEQAQVGAGEYITKDSDEIVWKIEQYHEEEQH